MSMCVGTTFTILSPGGLTNISRMGWTKQNGESHAGMVNAPWKAHKCCKDHSWRSKLAGYMESFWIFSLLDRDTTTETFWFDVSNCWPVVGLIFWSSKLQSKQFLSNSWRIQGYPASPGARSKGASWLKHGDGNCLQVDRLCQEMLRRSWDAMARSTSGVGPLLGKCCSSFPFVGCDFILS